MKRDIFGDVAVIGFVSIAIALFAFLLYQRTPLQTKDSSAQSIAATPVGLQSLGTSSITPTIQLPIAPISPTVQVSITNTIISFTPEPIVTVPPATSIPVGGDPLTRPTIDPNSINPNPTPGSGEAYHGVVNAYRAPKLTASLTQANIGFVGTVKQILSARWNTPDGKRPENPFASRGEFTIYRPVVVSVEQVIRGEALQADVTLYAIGGVVGSDAVEYISDALYTFTEGQKVVLLINSSWPTGTPYLAIIDKYQIGVDGVADNSYERIPLSSLIDIVRKAPIIVHK